MGRDFSVIEHMVLFQFGEETTQAQKDEVLRQLRELREHVAGIVDLQTNYNFSNRSQGYEIGLTVRFASKTDLEAYGPHPRHQAAVAYMKEVGLVNLLVVDFEIEDLQ